jgi:glycerate 2-kinase
MLNGIEQCSMRDVEDLPSGSLIRCCACMSRIICVGGRMRVLIAVDKFKGSLPGMAVAEAIVAGLRRAGGESLAGWEWDLCPIADGGEGTVAAVVGALRGDWVVTTAVDAQRRPCEVRYGLVPTEDGLGQRAVMEMSAASGLAQVLDLPLDPWRATTAGTGMMLRDAMRRGVRGITLGIGGSATNDGGLGMALALGYRFLDAAGAEVEALPEAWAQVERILPPAEALQMAPIQVACDVENPLLGESGATWVYGAQKGVGAAERERFEARLAGLAEMVKRDLGCDKRALPGAGAAGGLGFGLMAFAGAELASGFDLVAGVIRLEERVRAADVVITGEGRLDGQTLHGKGPVGVARLARRLGKRVYAVAGGIERGVGLEAEFDGMIATKPEGMALAEAMAAGARLIEESVEPLAKLLRE